MSELSEEALAMASCFELEGEVLGLEEVHAGLINSTWVVRCAPGSVGSRRYLLQRVNGTVFPKPEEVMENIRAVTQHLRDKLGEGNCGDLRPTLKLVAARGGGWWLFDEAGDLWRCYDFIEQSCCFEEVSSVELAYEAGRAFGEFGQLLADFPGEQLHEVIEGFHDTPARYGALQEAAAADVRGRAEEVRDELLRFETHCELFRCVTDGLATGEIPVRVTHNDTKISNVLFDAETEKALCVIDLDTVMPGSLLYDFGDLVRTTLGGSEDERTGEGLSLELFESLVAGYLAEVGSVLTRREKELLPQAGALISMELGMRFLTDYLRGDVYFRSEFPGQNLVRARGQLNLGESLLQSEPELRKMVESVLRAEHL